MKNLLRFKIFSFHLFILFSFYLLYSLNLFTLLSSLFFFLFIFFILLSFYLLYSLNLFTLLSSLFSYLFIFFIPLPFYPPYSVIFNWKLNFWADRRRIFQIRNLITFILLSFFSGETGTMQVQEYWPDTL